MSGFTYNEIGDELLSDVAEQFKPAVREIKHDKETIEGDLVLTEGAAELISNYFLGWKEEGRNLINDNEFDGAGAKRVFAGKYYGGKITVEEDHAGKKINIMILCLKISNSDETMQLILESSNSIEAPLDTSNTAALAAMLESSDADALLETSNAVALAALLESSDSDAAPLETANTTTPAGPLTFEDALLNALETSDASALDVLLNLSDSVDETNNVRDTEDDVEILNSDSDSEILTVNTNMVLLMWRPFKK